MNKLRTLQNRLRKHRRDTRPSALERAVMDVRRAFKLKTGPGAYLLAARMLIRAAQK